MKYFDVHLHMPTADRPGFDALLRHLDDEPSCVGGLLVLNTAQEIDVVDRYAAELPSRLVVVPPFDHPDRFAATGWFKIHPTLHRITLADVDRVRDEALALRPRGLMVHCFPWGKTLDYNTSLPLVLALAAAMPETTILATHGGGYESWQFRSHAGLFRNVIFDFSVTLAYYSDSDVLRPLQRYLRHSPDRVLFGSDWPTAPAGEQIAEMMRLAAGLGMSEEQLEQLLLTNARRHWPAAFTPEVQ